ncbi:putative DNA-binding transcriptional regulator YafY [Mumia flava]|uniref:Putative DNA-binding transcriptional regulator YafY n=1 Tax=Mumia flava TaxID=1348852 RepID=A0A0B2B6I3_9ACTN|nr:WYL domain-containing protein [Mumia flava]PJJ57670.1 putative DNA-binding transcriptional regulator YafY [Mumia flava]
MLETSARLLALLGLLQTRPDWPGPELAARLDVTTRTIRNDVERLRRLGYPIDAVRGTGGHYRLGAGAALPPLLLSDDEAVAVAVGLGSVRGIAGVAEAGERAARKLEQVLPHRLRRRVEAVASSLSAGPANTDSDVQDPEIDVAVLTRVADAVRDHERLRLTYDGRRRDVEPYRVVTWQRRWYLLAREVGVRPAPDDPWIALRLDWCEVSAMPQPRFDPRPLPRDDETAFVVREVASAGWAVHARITVYAPADVVRARINDAVGVVEAVDDESCVLVTGADSAETIAVYVGMLGLDFRVSGPPAVVEHLRALAGRYAAAVGPR